MLWLLHFRKATNCFLSSNSSCRSSSIWQTHRRHLLRTFATDAEYAAATRQKALVNSLKAKVLSGEVKETVIACEQKFDAKRRWPVAYQGMPGEKTPLQAPRCERIAQENVASQEECAQLVQATIQALQHEQAHGSYEMSFPPLIPAAESVLGYTNTALVLGMIDRIQTQVAADYDCAVTPSGALLAWLAPPPEGKAGSSPKDSLNFNTYWVPHVDKANRATYDISAILYLNTCGRDFTGGWFAFNDEDSNRLVAPVRGRLLTFTSGFENLHQASDHCTTEAQVQRVETGNRFVLSVWFQAVAPQAASESSFFGPG
ncbi:hypothetical protein CYMTET_24001 [Cymbomonas tetramitiformis]|uniref:Prolyl 4-hydroxylase alpha subunit domain-containing protein n=1 Tax=Cymbomonas tetramitiformis TaxID=36881 RepID=A0AAE0L0Q5_9CHLO|nr:hypothetical protein CYMTET_24001 [Cymbomonas tetramitiformis]